MKHVMIFMVVSLTVAFTVATSAHAADPTETLRKASAVFKQQYGSGQYAESMKQINIIKDAGLSYQNYLAIPLKGSLACKDKAQLRVLIGMISFDSHYAMIFGKKKEYFDTLQYINTEIMPRLKELDQLNMSVIVKDSSNIIADGFTKPENLQKYRESYQQQFDQLAEKVASSPDTMVLLVDGWYGAVLESLYVACTLSQNEKWGDSLSKLFGDQFQRLGKVDKVLSLLKYTKYESLAHQPERSKALASIRGLYEKKKGQLDRKDISMILEQVKAARAEYIKLCR